MLKGPTVGHEATRGLDKMIIDWAVSRDAIIRQEEDEGCEHD